MAEEETLLSEQEIKKEPEDIEAESSEPVQIKTEEETTEKEETKVEDKVEVKQEIEEATEETEQKVEEKVDTDQKVEEKIDQDEKAEEKIDQDRKVDQDQEIDKIEPDELPVPDETVVTASTKEILITNPGECCEAPHRLKVSIVGAGKVGMACAISILMKRIASEICLIDKNSAKAEAEAEDIRHAGLFLGNPVITGSSDISTVRESVVVIIAIGEPTPGENFNMKHNLEIYKKVIPAIAKLASRTILLIATQPIDAMSYVAWKISKFPYQRVIGIGTLVDTMRFQYFLSERLNLANTSISCACIGAQGNNSVPVWSGVHISGVRLRDINPRIGEIEDPEKWHEVTKLIHECDARLNRMKNERGPICWSFGVCAAEIVDAIVRNTMIVLPASTHIHSCSHGTDKDVYMSVPCVLGREGVHHTVRQQLTDQEKSSLQACADSIRNALRDSGILRDVSEDVQD